MDYEFLIPIVAIVTPMSMVGWIVYVVVDGRRRRERLKATAEFHAKLLDRIGTAKEFGDFLSTDGGQKFLVSIAADSPKSAGTHIVRSTENGIVCLSIGLGVLLLGWAFPEARGGFTIIGTILAACGIGFLLSCLASYRLSTALGLLNGDKTGSTTSGI
jgi:hypothetical protein